MRKHLWLLGALLLGYAAVCAADSTLTFAQIRASASNIKAGEKFVALTFDDGPNPATTPTILKLLSAHKAQATFFMLGINVQHFPALAKAVASQGHEIGNHTYDHKNLKKLSTHAIGEQLTRTQTVMAHAHLKPLWFRPPYGAGISKASPIASASHMRTVLWSVDARDWMRKDPKAVEAAILKTVKNGDIILLHDTKRVTTKALGSLLTHLSQRGYRFVTMSQWAKRISNIEEGGSQEEHPDSMDQPITVAQTPTQPLG